MNDKTAQWISAIQSEFAPLLGRTLSEPIRVRELKELRAAGEDSDCFYHLLQDIQHTKLDLEQVVRAADNSVFLSDEVFMWFLPTFVMAALITEKGDYFDVLADRLTDDIKARRGNGLRIIESAPTFVTKASLQCLVDILIVIYGNSDWDCPWHSANVRKLKRLQILRTALQGCTPGA